MLDQQVGTPEVGSEAYWRKAAEKKWELAISGTPYTRFSVNKERQAFFEHCEPVYGAIAKIIGFDECRIPTVTHKNVPSKFENFLRVTCTVEVDQEVDTLLFHADDIWVD